MPSPEERPSGHVSILAHLWEYVRREPAVVAFGVGAVIVLLNMFSPSIDQARVTERLADMDYADQEQKRAEEEAKDPAPAGNEEGAPPRPRNKTWLKQRHKFEQRIDEARFSAAGNTWWYQHLMRIGFLFLGVGALGLTAPAQPPPRRVVGAIILIAILLLAFNSFAHYGIRFEIGPAVSGE